MVASFWVPEGELALWEVTELDGGKDSLNCCHEHSVRAIRAFSADFA